MFHLTYDGGSIKCPFCQTPFHVEWDTEYGEPSFGDHDTECLECKKAFSFQCYYEYNVLAKV